MVRVKRREEPTPVDEANAAAVRFIHLKKEIKDRTDEVNQLKTVLMDFLDRDGEEDEQGSLWHDLPADIEGIHSIKRERRVSNSQVDEDKALAILQSKKLDKRCYRLEPVLDQDEVMKAVSEGLISEKELAEMFPPKVSWALVTSKG